MAQVPPTTDLARLRWRCRRGLLELDLVLGSFLDRGYQHLDELEKQAFLKLLELPDTELLGYVQGQHEPADPELINLFNKITQVIDN